MRNLDEILSGIVLLGFDTSPLIYFVEQHPLYVDVIREIIQRVDSGVLFGYSSVVTLTEVLVQPKRMGDLDLENNYRQVLQHGRHFTLLPIDHGIAEHAADLRSRYSIRTPDALQIAAVLSVGGQAFLTNDKRLKQMTELKILILDDLIGP
jgi:predicted nucleic acid-binding protein